MVLPLFLPTAWARHAPKKGFTIAGATDIDDRKGSKNSKTVLYSLRWLYCTSLAQQGRPVSLQLWDVAGSQLNARPSHHSLIGQGAEGVLYVLDVTSRDSLQAVDEWDRALSTVRRF